MLKYYSSNIMRNYRRPHAQFLSILCIICTTFLHITCEYILSLIFRIPRIRTQNILCVCTLELCVYPATNLRTAATGSFSIHRTVLNSTCCKVDPLHTLQGPSNSTSRFSWIGVLFRIHTIIWNFTPAISLVVCTSINLKLSLLTVRYSWALVQYLTWNS